MRTIGRLFAVLAILAVISTSLAKAQQPIPWESSLENAQRLAGQSNRLVLIHFWAAYCGACKRMEAEVLTQPAVAAEMTASYVPVRINADNFPTVAQRYGITALPTTVIITPQGQMIDSFQGRLEATDYCARIHRIAAQTKQGSGAVYAQMPLQAAPATPAAIPQAQPVAPSSQPIGPSLGMASSPTSAGSPQVAAPASNSAPTEDRYADFFRRNQQSPAQPVAQPAISSPATPNPQIVTNNYQAAQPSGPAIAPPQMPQPQGYTASIPPTNPAMVGMPPAASVASASPYASQSPAPAMPSAMQPPANPGFNVPMSQPATSMGAASALNTPAAASTVNPPLCLDGYCPVTLVEKQQWVIGDRRWGVIHRNRLYLFAGPEEKQRFFADPDRYAPANAGNDVIVTSEQGQTVPGMREHGVFYGGRVYLFSSEATLDKFSRNPTQYTNQILGANRTSFYPGRTLQ